MPLQTLTTQLKAWSSKYTKNSLFLCFDRIMIIPVSNLHQFQLKANVGTCFWAHKGQKNQWELVAEKTKQCWSQGSGNCRRNVVLPMWLGWGGEMCVGAQICSREEEWIKRPNHVRSKFCFWRVVTQFLMQWVHRHLKGEWWGPELEKCELSRYNGHGDGWKGLEQVPTSVTIRNSSLFSWAWLQS